MSKRELQVAILQEALDRLQPMWENRDDLELLVAVQQLINSVKKGNSQDVIANFSNIVARELQITIQRLESPEERIDDDGVPLFA